MIGWQYRSTGTDGDKARSILANVTQNVHAEIEEINFGQVNTKRVSQKTKSRRSKVMNTQIKKAQTRVNKTFFNTRELHAPVFLQAGWAVGTVWGPGRDGCSADASCPISYSQHSTKQSYGTQASTHKHSYAQTHAFKSNWQCEGGKKKSFKVFEY